MARNGRRQRSRKEIAHAFELAFAVAEQEAAQRGEPQANTLIARIYADGLGVQKDDKKAYEWYARAAQLGLARRERVSAGTVDRIRSTRLVAYV